MPDLFFAINGLAVLSAGVTAIVLAARHGVSGWAGPVAAATMLMGGGVFVESLRERVADSRLPWPFIAQGMQVVMAATLVHALYGLKRVASLHEKAQPVPLVWAAWCVAPIVVLATWLWAPPSGSGSSMALLPSPLTAYLGVTLIVALAQCERLLTKPQDATRYQLKFVVIGLAALAGYHLYRTSRDVFGLNGEAGDSVVPAVVCAMSAGLIFAGSSRVTTVFPAPTLYVPAGVLHRSITILAVVGYLGMGLWLRASVVSTGWNQSEALGVIALFLTGISLAVLLASRTLQVRLRQWTARIIYRARHDYRAQWLDVTNAFQNATTVDRILDQLLELLSRTFGAPRIAIWMHFEADDRYHRVRSVNTGTPPPPLDGGHPIVSRLRSTHEPMEIGEQHDIRPASNSGASNPSQGALCVPLWSGGRLEGFITLSREGDRARYGEDDRQLLRAIAHHAGAILAQTRLAEELRNAAEFEALHRVAAFCLHDLKNLTAQLSLVVQNAEAHGNDPRFQKSALRTVTGTVQKMMALMAKLSMTAPRAGDAEEINVHVAIAETLRALGPAVRGRVKQLGESVPPIRIARDQFHQILLNILLNAQQAAGDQAEIRIVTRRKDGAVMIQIRDNGPGMDEQRLRTLFTPFRSSKPDGLGIGMYECKRILAGYKGSIHVESEPGQGTEVTITLPVSVAVTGAHTRSIAEAV